MYFKTLSEFKKTNNNEIVSYLKKLFPSAIESQVNSWINLIDELKSNQNLDKLHDDIIIGIEIELPINGMAMDLCFVGLDDQGLKNIIIIEVKQWSDSYIRKLEFSDYREFERVLHPQIQVSRHSIAFKDYLDIGYKYNVRKLVYIKNIQDKTIKYLVDENPIKSTKSIYIGNNLNEILTTVSKRLVTSSDEILKELNNASYKPSKDIVETMNSISTKEEPFILNEEQKTIVDDIFNEINNGKKIVRITGPAGSGKTAILLHLYVKALNNMDTDNIRPYFLPGTQNTSLYRSIYSQISQSFVFSFPLLGMIRNNKQFRNFIFMDEAQYNQEGIIRDIVNENIVLFLCYDLNQTINSNNALNELEELEKRSDFVSYRINNSVRFNGSQLFEKNVNKFLDGDDFIIEDDKFDFQLFSNIELIEKKLVELSREKTNSTIAVTGLLSNDSENYTNRADSKIFTKWGNKEESKWYKYIQNKNYLKEYNGLFWVGTWWMPGLDVDYTFVIIGGDAKITKNGIIGIPEESKHYLMMISVAEKIGIRGIPQRLSNYEKINYILNYIKQPENKIFKEKFEIEFNMLIRNLYYIMLTRGRKGCYVYYKSDLLD